jgi:hypothetical protein
MNTIKPKQTGKLDVCLTSTYAIKVEKQKLNISISLLATKETAESFIRSNVSRNGRKWMGAG